MLKKVKSKGRFTCGYCYFNEKCNKLPMLMHLSETGECLFWTHPATPVEWRERKKTGLMQNGYVEIEV